MLQVKVYDIRGGKLIAKSPKVKTFKETRPFLDKYFPQHYCEIHGKKAKNV